MKRLLARLNPKTNSGSKQLRMELDGVDPYELLSDSLPFGVSLISPEMNVLRSNAKMREWFPRTDLSKPQKCYEVFNDPPRDSPCPECRKHRNQSGRTPNTFLRRVCTAGGYRTLRLKSVPLVDAKGVSQGFLEIAEDVTEQESHEELQKKYQRFLEQLNRLSAQVVNIPDKEWNTEIHQILRQLGEFFDVDRCCLFDFSPEKNLLTNTHEWCAPGVTAQIEYLQEVPESALPWWFEQLQKLKPVYYPDVNFLPPEATLEKQELLRQEIKSLLYFPMKNEHGRCIGCMGFDVVRAPRTWPEDQIAMLQVFTSLLTGAILRKQNRADLLHRERQYRQLVDNSLNGILTLELICDVDGTPLDLHIQSINPAGCRILNLPRDLLIDKTASETVPELVAPGVLKTFSKLIRTREGQTFQLTAHQETRHLSLSAYPLQGLHFALILTDHTEREVAMKALETKTRELESYFHSSLDMLCILTKDGRFIEVNPEWGGILGYAPDSLAGRSLMDLVPEADRPRLRDFLSDAIQSEHSLDHSIEMKHANGSLRWLELRARSIGDLLYVAARDVTARKLAEDEHNLLQQQLNQALKMESVGRLAGGVAHDFNNSLQVILGNAEMALNFQNPVPTLKSTLEEIRDAAKRSSVLTRQLLAFARKQNIEPKETDLNESLQATIKMLKRLIGEQIKLEWELEKNLWTVFIDPGQVDQILANLCVNAGDAIEAEGSVWIKTENVTLSMAESVAIPQACPGEYVRLSVRDSGSGIPPELQAKIFEPFVTTKAEGKGTGLGLATVHGIVLQNKGFITLESTPGSGSCFNVYLPRHTSTTSPQKPSPKKQDLLKGTEHVLIVEDEPMILQMTEMTLNKLGYNTLSASSPKQALALLENPDIPIDLLLTDVVMPEMDGKELSQKLTLKRPELRTLFMSGYTQETMKKYGITGTDQTFIQKPFSVAAISQKIRAVLDTPAS